ncbi:unnamed protein product [Callosobruchus maculatus]|uniref:Uncharacterized protein n=1 Tax=Callosobruchus maculatus TaxID=64391 RepID=A0A653BUK8_CALMS|nr:unnamed protein product [Callosobruchus maculatus]
MRTETSGSSRFCPFALREVSVLAELALGHLRYSLTDVPPQSNSPPGSVLESNQAGGRLTNAYPKKQRRRHNGANRPYEPTKSRSTTIRHSVPWLENTVTAAAS